MRLSAILAAVALVPAAPLAAQQAASSAASAPSTNAAALRVAPSGRATTVVSLAVPRAQGAPAPATPPAPLRIAIDYGQPHARGREVVGKVVPFDSVWRTGANSATTLTTDVDLTIGGARVPKGAYTLFTLPTKSGWKLIINRQTGQWGTEYHAERDLARVDLATRALREPAESFTIWLVPAPDAPAHGTLRMAWGNTELSTDWKVVD